MQAARGACRLVVLVEGALRWESEAPTLSSRKQCPRRSTMNSEVSFNHMTFVLHWKVVNRWCVCWSLLFSVKRKSNNVAAESNDDQF